MHVSDTNNESQSDLIETVHALDIIIDIPSVVEQDPSLAFHDLLSRVPGFFHSLSPSSPHHTATATISRISGAMTNLVFLATTQNTQHNQKVIIRVFGAGGLLFSRHQERGMFLTASRLGIGPRCLLEFGNGRVEEYIPGSPASAVTLRQPAVATAIATALAKFHTSMLCALPGIREESKPTQGDGDGEDPSRRCDDSGDSDALWGRLRGWLATAVDTAPDESSLLGITKEATMEEIDEMQGNASRAGLHPWLAFCHNDLQYGNVLLLLEHEEEAPTTTTTAIARLIDYEYSAVTDIGFDVSNHFCEYAADYHHPSSEDGTVLDWRRGATEEEKIHFCTSYIHALMTHHPEDALTRRILSSSLSSGSVPPTEAAAAAAHSLVQRANVLEPLSHLKWGLWALIQSNASDVDFDYLGYARQRLQKYLETKQQLLVTEFV